METSPIYYDPTVLLNTLEQLIALEATDVESTLEQVTNLLAIAFNADKVDVFLHQAEEDKIEALGTSDTPMGKLQEALGLDCLLIAEGGRIVETYLTGQPYLTTDARDDPGVLEGIKGELGVRAMMVVPMFVAGVRRGVVVIADGSTDKFNIDHLRFLEAVSRWVGEITHRAELVEQIQAETAARTRQVVAEELLTVLAHDLKNYLTPLNARLVLLRTLARRADRQEELEHVEEARRALAYLRALIDSLLDAARLEQGTFALVQTPANLSVLVRETVDNLRTGDIEIQVDAPERVMANVDGARFQSALANLISNALKHSGIDMPIRVSLRQVGGQADRRVVVAVADTGPGIEAELLPRLFERFAAGRQSPGLGIGLYTARQIAEAHGGTLTVDSKTGVGTTFYLTLPTGIPTL